MRGLRMRGLSSVVSAAAVALVFCPGGAAHAEPAASPATGPVPVPGAAALKDRALAYAERVLAARTAAAEGRHDEAARLERLARSERDGVLAEVARLDPIGSNVANLRIGISGEAQDLDDYARWSREAAADGCDAAADLFAEVRRDEAGHLVRFATALQALIDPESGTVIPDPPQATRVPAVPNTPTCSARTVANLRMAMAGEALAFARYTMFADYAFNTGPTELGSLFRGTAEVELWEHFTAEGNLAGLVADETEPGMGT